jgi:hypothetical protein
MKKYKIFEWKLKLLKNCENDMIFCDIKKGYHLYISDYLKCLPTRVLPGVKIV